MSSFVQKSPQLNTCPETEISTYYDFPQRSQSLYNFSPAPSSKTLNTTPFTW